MLESLSMHERVAPDQPINLFYALKPPAAVAKQVHELAHWQRVGHGMFGRPLAADRLHITLLSVGSFMGPVPDDIMDAALAAGASVSLPAFSVSLDRVTSFARATGKRPYVLLGGDGVAGIMPLHCSLVGGIFASGLDMRFRTSFNPHMTLLYDFEHHAETPVEPVSWVAREFVLIESRVRLTQHVVRGRWALR